MHGLRALNSLIVPSNEDVWPSVFAANMAFLPPSVAIRRDHGVHETHANALS